jgi:hypothetical protein
MIPVEDKMIETVDDVIKVVDEAKNKHNLIINFILKGDGLTKFLYEFYGKIGY